MHDSMILNDTLCEHHTITHTRAHNAAVKPETHMLYAGAKSHLVQKCDVGKVRRLERGGDP